VFVWVSEFFTFAASPGIGVVTVSFWVESTADEKFVVSLIDGEWSVDGVLEWGSGGQEFWVNSWDGGGGWHFSSFASVTVPVSVSVVVQWVDGGTGPQVFQKFRDEGHLAVAQVFVTVVVVGNGAVTGESHISHVPSDVDVEIFSGGIADVSWVSVFTINDGASVASGQEVASVVEFVQNWSGSSSQVWEVAPATISPDFSQGDWDIAFAWWAVIPDLAGVVVGSVATVGQGVDNRFVNVFWDTVLLGFGGEGSDEGGFGFGGVVPQSHLFVEVDELGFGETSELGDFGVDGGASGESGESESSNELHFVRLVVV